MKRGRLRLAVASTVAIMAGCAAPAPVPAPDAAIAAVTDVQVLRHSAGTSVQGRPIEAVQLGGGAAVVLLIATIHGDEAAGTALLERLERRLLAEPWRLARRTVVLVPDANPDGRVADRRGNAAGVDLNRDFPAANRSPGRPPAPTQPEAAAIAALVRELAPELIVSIHQPLACVDWDGPEPAATIAIRMAERCRLPARRLGARDGSLGAWAGETLGIPVVTFELPREAGADPEADWRRYGTALLAAVQAGPEAAARRRPWPAQPDG